MAKTLEELMEEYNIGDTISTTRGKTGTIVDIHRQNGKISELVVEDNSGKRSTVPIQTRHDVHRKK